MIGEMLLGSHLWAKLLLQGTGCLAAGLVLSYLLGRRAARAHQVLLATLLAAVLMPGAYLFVKHFELGVLAPPAPVRETMPTREPPAGLAPTERIALGGPLVAQPAYEQPAVGTPASATELATREPIVATVPWRTVFLIGWAVATAILLGRLTLRFILGLRLLIRSEALPDERLDRALDQARARLGLTGAVQVRFSDKVHSPIIWCWARSPVLLVQRTAQQHNDRVDWTGVFCHELAHWKRRDHAGGLLAELLSAALPWHPLLWWARRRLLTLSENACDDWVLAGGRTAVEYAESLLDLSPENQLAFLPTVVGKEKAMKERICRILKERCGDPRVGTCWIVGVSIVALLATAGIAFAQRRPARAESPEARERAELREREQIEKRELALAGRRNVLSRLLDQLVAQAREIEATLREHGDELGEEGHIRRAELEALHQQIKLVERQLHGLDREPERGERPEAARRRPRQADAAAHLEELIRHREELQERARARQRALEGLGDNEDEAARDLEAELSEIRANVRRVEEEMAAAQARRARAERERATEAQERIRREVELARDRTERAREAAVERARRYLEMRLEDETSEARERAEHARNLAQRMRELQMETAAAKGRLEEVGDEDSDEARELRNHVENMNAETAEIEKQLQQLRRPRATATAPRRRREGIESRAAPYQRRQELRPDIEEMERELQLHEEEGRGDTDEAQELRAALRRTRNEMQRAEAVKAAREAARKREEAVSQVARSGRAAEGPQREREGGNEALRRQVEELRGKVDDMHEEMQHLRKMLQQLLERTHHQPTTPPEGEPGES